jgi:glycosidase
VNAGHHYRKLIELRKTYSVFRNGSFTLLLPEDPDIFAYTRDTDNEHLLVVCNLTDKVLHLDAPEAFRGAEVLLSNYTEASESLRPYEAVMLYYKD